MTKTTCQYFDLRKETVMQIDDVENTVSFCKRSTFDEVYKDEELLEISAKRFLDALLQVQAKQIKSFITVKMLRYV